ncbi:type ISP restriction/modification enzyme [Chelativorans xinjiangense]|uniref:type ISP restriction/modification enzyme n=1 Tax=Chelativorans xinjiangense TaxID=2681485 RepID=UPI00135BFE3A|nr:type ISP restriction/modification enzyme [Chelativorans xinjiangense]
MTQPFDAYLRKLRETPIEEHTEHTGRAALETLLGHFAERAMAQGITVQHEPKRVADKGAPDFKVERQGMILGYVEVKEIGANLDKVLKSDQIAKYRKLSDNIVLTDYLQFIRIDGKGKVLDRKSLAFPSDLEGRTIRVDPDRAETVARVLGAFFSSPPQGLSRAPQLAVALATRSKLLRDYLAEELIRQEKTDREGRLHALYDVFREQVFHELAVKEFADAFAQMLAYGLFLAKLNAGDEDVIRLDNVRRFIPGSFRLIRELVSFLEEMQEAEYDEAKWVVDEILSIVNGLAIDNIRDDLSFRQRKAISRKVRAGDEEEHRLFERDPFIYFYEDFLKAYDKETRKSRGVYYTPPPVVNFIVRAVDDVLKETFKIGDGLADDSRVTVLDFAAGTGTFLLEVMQRIFGNIGGSEAGKADAVVREHMLKNLYGFEYLIAPYTIAHLKLSQYLKDKGHPLHDEERLQVFLTNTLEPVEPQRNLLLPAVSAEVEAAQTVKEQPILVILGNPPYSGLSRNRGPHATASIERYKYVDSVHFGEKKHWLHNDYVKFLAFAQDKMDHVDEGIVGVITDNSYLDNPTFRGMRQSLLKSFDQIDIIDLHGNLEKREVTPDGLRNENVFDIKQGVSISIFIKKPGIPKHIRHFDLWGSRLEKYTWTTHNSLASTAFSVIEPMSPHYFFKPFSGVRHKEYGEFASVDQIFINGSVGITTSRDHLVIDNSLEKLLSKIEEFYNVNNSDDYIRRRFSINDNENWSIRKTRKGLEGEQVDRNRVTSICFGPFDIKNLYLDEKLVFRPRYAVTRPMLQENIALLTDKITRDEPTAFVSSTPAGHKSASRYDPTYIFPLYTFQSAKEKSNHIERLENITPDFRAFLDARYDHHYSPEEILGYIYAVLHAPTYRRRYTEFLRIDFPRIPFPDDSKDFEALSALGWALVQAHLMRDLPRWGLADYHGNGDHTVEHVRWSAEDERISINKTQSYAPVPEAVWNFRIGGYQVIDKYLKSRKGRTLSLDEINQVARIADALAFTVDQMERIDTAYAQAFPDRG